MKLGNLGIAPLIEFLLDERADREDIDVRVFGSGAKMEVPQATEITQRALESEPDLLIIVTPNATLPGPTQAIKMVEKTGIPAIVVSDKPTLKITSKLASEGLGYLIVTADPMIGARREFLDPSEMVIFNSDIIKVLSITGACNAVFQGIDGSIDSLKAGRDVGLPHIIIDKETAVEAAGFRNQYAKAKAMASYEIAEHVTDVTQEGCFKVKDHRRYIPLVASAHEMMRVAAQLADEAREIEKGGDRVTRTPHYTNGRILRKSRLIEKPR